MATSWALISGASTGLGRETALQLAAQNFQVIAGVRSEKAVAALEAEAAQRSVSGKLIPVQLDVTVQPSIDAAAARARELTGTDGLRAVINNAGIVVPGPVEFVSAEEWRKQFDVNFFGMIELTRATLPLLRQGAAALGAFVPRLLFISSIGGRVAQPGLAPYTASKFATSALGDSLRLELRRQGIGVTIIEPGAVATEIWTKGDASADEFVPDHPARKLYGPEIDGLIAATRRIAPRALAVNTAAAIIVRSVLAPRPKARVLVGSDAKIAARMRALLPLSWFDSILMKEFGIAGLPVTGTK